MSEIKKVILAALLLATFIILDRVLTVNTQFLAVNLSLVAIMVAGMILGWKYSIIVGALRRSYWCYILAVWTILFWIYI